MRRHLPLLGLLAALVASSAGAAPVCAADQPRSIACVDAAFNQFGARISLAYRRLVRDTPDAQGSVTLTLAIAADGSVQDIDATLSPGAQGLDGDFLERVKRMVSAWNFGPAASAGRYTHQLDFLPSP